MIEFLCHILGGIGLVFLNKCGVVVEGSLLTRPGERAYTSAALVPDILFIIFLPLY